MAAGPISNSPDLIAEVPMAAWLLKFLMFGLDLSLLGIAAVGIAFRLLTAGRTHLGQVRRFPLGGGDTHVRAVRPGGVAALLFPFVIRQSRDRTALSRRSRLPGIVMALVDAAFLLFGAPNSYTPIALILNTMPK